MKREGFVQLEKENPDIVEIKPLRVVSVDTVDVGEAEVEYIGEATYVKENKEEKAKIKMYSTSCSIQVQCMSNQNGSNKNGAKYLADLIVQYINNIAKNCAAYDQIRQKIHDYF